jgi:hypothetical protein
VWRNGTRHHERREHAKKLKEATDKGDFIDLMDSDDDDTETTKPATARKLVWMSTAQTERAYSVYQPSCHLLQPTDSSAFRVPRRGLRISNFK